MTPEIIYNVAQQAMVVGVKLAVPLLIPGLIIGLIVAMFQAATQINESTLTFVPKVVIMGVVLLLMGPVMLQMFLDYFRDLIKDIPSLIG
jgi:flagellar biosynthetic protein FliQ